MCCPCCKTVHFFLFTVKLQSNTFQALYLLEISFFWGKANFTFKTLAGMRFHSLKLAVKVFCSILIYMLTCVRVQCRPPVSCKRKMPHLVGQVDFLLLRRFRTSVFFCLHLCKFPQYLCWVTIWPLPEKMHMVYFRMWLSTERCHLSTKYLTFTPKVNRLNGPKSYQCQLAKKGSRHIWPISVNGRLGTSA